MKCGNSYSTSPPAHFIIAYINDVPTLLSGKCPMSLDYYFEMSLQVVSMHVLSKSSKIHYV